MSVSEEASGEWRDVGNDGDEDEEVTAILEDGQYRGSAWEQFCSFLPWIPLCGAVIFLFFNFLVTGRLLWWYCGVVTGKTP